MLFNRTDFDIKTVVNNIQSGSWALPELQRPFVWGDAKARDLIKSILNGYPVGFLILWDQPGIEKSKQIGVISHSYSSPHELIIDGQQRLTSLFAIITGAKIIDEAFAERNIILSYNPKTDVVEVANEAFKKSPEWIYNLTDIFQTENLYSYSKHFIDRLIEAYEKSGIDISTISKEDEIGKLANQLSYVKSTILNYLLPTLTINKNADEESVADIFVNINSGGTQLNQSDFILTLVSVHYPEGRNKIEEFCRNTKKHNPDPKKDIYNPIISLDPADIVRVVMAYGFKRGRLKYAYKLLRGADFDKKGEISEALRNKRFDDFRIYLDHVLDRNNFLEFLKCVNASGFVKKELLPSINNIVYAYTFWLIGRYDFKISVSDLKPIITKAIFFFNLTSRYSSSFEGLIENELIELDDLSKTTFDFATYFDNIENTILTNDYFNITLVENLKTSSNKSPLFLTYIASQNLLDTKVLFSKPEISTLTSYSEWINGTRKAVELHHLFPKQYLKNKGYKNKEINQVANYAFIEWTTNMDISDEAPSKYFNSLVSSLSEEEIKKMLAPHALSLNWQDMDYLNFLDERRKLMANIIKKGFEKLNS